MNSIKRGFLSKDAERCDSLHPPALRSQCSACVHSQIRRRQTEAVLDLFETSVIIGRYPEGEEGTNKLACTHSMRCAMSSRLTAYRSGWHLAMSRPTNVVSLTNLACSFRGMRWIHTAQRAAASRIQRPPPHPKSASDYVKCVAGQA